jgi:hypothetical protein
MLHTDQMREHASRLLAMAEQASDLLDAVRAVEEAQQLHTENK